MTKESLTVLLILQLDAHPCDFLAGNWSTLLDRAHGHQSSGMGYESWRTVLEEH